MKRNPVLSVVADGKHDFSDLFSWDMTKRFFEYIFSKGYDEPYFFFISMIKCRFSTFWTSIVKHNNDLKPWNINVFGAVDRETSGRAIGIFEKVKERSKLRKKTTKLRKNRSFNVILSFLYVILTLFCRSLIVQKCKLL